MTWEDEALKGRSLPEGEHVLRVLGEPTKETNKFGKEQYTFPAEVDGVPNNLNLALPVRKLVAAMRKAGKQYPIVVRYVRTGMDVKSTFSFPPVVPA